MSINSIATQKLGIDCPMTATTRMPTSITEPRCKAAMMPSGMASMLLATTVSPARISVNFRCCSTSGSNGW